MTYINISLYDRRDLAFFQRWEGKGKSKPLFNFYYWCKMRLIHSLPLIFISEILISLCNSGKVNIVVSHFDIFVSQWQSCLYQKLLLTKLYLSFQFGTKAKNFKVRMGFESLTFKVTNPVMYQLTAIEPLVCGDPFTANSWLGAPVSIQSTLHTMLPGITP